MMAEFNEELLGSDEILSEIVHRLVEQFHPECIYLFGSRSRAQQEPDSDYDLMMIVSSSSLPRYKREQKAFRALCGMGISKEILVLTRQEFESRRTVICSLPATVEREGRILYAV